MIYFVRRPDNGRIKTGTTIRLAERLRELAKEAGGGLEVLAIAEGSRPEELALHRRFSHLRAVNEWFEPGDDLLGFIISDARPWDGEDEPRFGSVKLRMDVIKSARIVAAYRGVSIAEMLSDILCPMLAQMVQEAGDPGPRPEGGPGE